MSGIMLLCVLAICAWEGMSFLLFDVRRQRQRIPARFAAITPLIESSIIRHSLFFTLVFFHARRKMAGSGLVFFTLFLVMIASAYGSSLVLIRILSTKDLGDEVAMT